MSELAEIRDRTQRIEVMLEGFVKETKAYRDCMQEKLDKGEIRLDKQDDRLKGIEKRFWQFSGALTVLVALWEVFKGKLFKP